MNGPLTLEVLNHCAPETFVALLDGVWEHAPWVAREAAAGRPYADVDALHRAMLAIVQGLSEERLRALLRGHPELAGREARGGLMTADSTHEQGGLALTQLAHEEAARWDALNARYRERFGFPFILCVKRHTRASALRCFERRLAHTPAQELAEAVREIGHITRLRLAARVAGHGLADVAGVLTTHVLDTSRGRPAAGMRVALHEWLGDSAAAGTRLLAEAVTDENGQTGAPLLGAQPLRTGRYELRFGVGDYYRRLGVVQGDWPFLDVVPVAFGIDDPAGDYHVPLTVTPWAYATYRGQ